MKTKIEMYAVCRAIIKVFVFEGYSLKESELCLMNMLEANRMMQRDLKFRE